MGRALSIVRKVLRWLTTEQYERIDEDYIDLDQRDYAIVWTLVAVTLCMVIPRYFGRDDHIETIGFAKRWMSQQTHPTLYPAMYANLFKIVNYLLVPLIVIKLVYRHRLRDYGLKVTRDKRILALYLLMLAVVMPLVWLVSDTPAFLAKYPKYAQAAHSYQQLVMWELAYGFQFVLLEFFFRGFALFTLARSVGHRAIFIMVIPYCMIHFAKPMPETLGSIITGIALGTMALRTRSIWGGVVLHIAVAWSMDFFAMWHKGDLQRLLAR
jgi:membrane protease YdiL (CAAX protease family)